MVTSSHNPALLPQLSLSKSVAQLLVVRASGMVFDQQIRYPVWEPKAEILRHWVQDWGGGRRDYARR